MLLINFNAFIILQEASLPYNSLKVKRSDTESFGFLPPVIFRVS